MTSYTASMGGTVYQGATAVTERLSFASGFFAGCGEAALLVVLNAVKGVPTSGADVTAVIRQAVNQHVVSAGGVSNPGQLENLAGQYGVSLTSGNYKSLASQYAGSKPVIVGLSNARALGGNNSNVSGHYITIVGKTKSGQYIVSDPNSNESVQGKFVVYSPQQLDAAQPFWAAVPNGPTLSSIGWPPIGGPILGGVSGAAGQAAGSIGSIGSPFNIKIQLPTTIQNWLDKAGPVWASWLDPIRLFKLIVGGMLIVTVIGVVLFEGVADAVGRLTSGVSNTAGKAAQIGALFG